MNSGAPQKVSIKKKIVTSFRLDAARTKMCKWNLSEKSMVPQQSGNMTKNSFSNTNSMILQNSVFYSVFLW